MHAIWTSYHISGIFLKEVYFNHFRVDCKLKLSFDWQHTWKWSAYHCSNHVSLTYSASTLSQKQEGELYDIFLDNKCPWLKLICIKLTATKDCTNILWQNTHCMALYISATCTVSLHLLLQSGQEHKVTQFQMSCWTPEDLCMHLSSCHHGSHWTGVGDTEEDWKQAHCGPRKVSQLAGAFFVIFSKQSPKSMSLKDVTFKMPEKGCFSTRIIPCALCSEQALVTTVFAMYYICSNYSATTLQV